MLRWAGQRLLRLNFVATVGRTRYQRMRGKLYTNFTLLRYQRDDDATPLERRSRQRSVHRTTLA